MWLDNMDIGLGNGLRNKLAEAIAKGDDKKAKELVSSTFFMLIIIIIPMTGLLMLIIHLADLYPIMDPEHQCNNLTKVVSVAVLFVCMTFIFKFIGNFYQGLQLPAISNLITTCGHTLVLAGTFILYIAGSKSIMAIAIVNTLSPLIIYMMAYPYTFYIKYKKYRPSIHCFNTTLIKGLFLIGIKFFILQMCGAVIMQSVNFLISRYFTPALVTPYQLAYRYFSIVMLAFTIITTPYWSATTDAWAKGDIEWIRNSMRRTRKTLLIAFFGIILMILFSPIFYHLWVGNMTKVPLAMTIAMALYTMIFIYVMAYSYFLNGIGALRLQLICSVTMAILFIPAAIAVAKLTHQVISILILMCIINIPCIICDQIQFNKIINGNAKGIWKV